MPASRYTCRDVAQALERIAPLSSGIADDELGFVFGEPERPTSGVACLWAADTRSIRRCIDRGLDLLVCHEGLWLPEQTSPWYELGRPATTVGRGSWPRPVGVPAEPLRECCVREGLGRNQLTEDGSLDGLVDGSTIFSNRERRAMLERHQLVVYRSHSNWDALPLDGVPDQALAALGISGLQEVARQKFFSVQQLPSPLRVREVAKHTQRGLSFSACRVFGDRDQRVRRFAILIGGFGENQWHMPQAAIELGAETIILGEMSEFIVVACLERGVPVIETLHSASEIPAIRRQAAVLAENLPGLRVEYVPSGATAFGI